MSPNLHFSIVMPIAIVSLGLVPLFEKLAVQSGADLFPLVISINIVTLSLLAVPAWKHRPAPIRRQWQSLLLIGGLASGLVMLLNLWSLETTSATHRSVFQAMYPAATALFAYFLLKERLPGRGYFVIALMTMGIIIHSLRGFAWRFSFGDLLLFISLPVMGFCDTWAKRTLGTLAPEWVAFGRFTFGTLVLLMLIPFTGSEFGWPVGNAWLWVIASGLAISLGIIMLYQGMALRGAAIATALASMSPVLTVTLEWLWLERQFTVVELTGMAIVVIGGILLSRKPCQETTS